MKIYLLKRKGKQSTQSSEKSKKAMISLYFVYYFGADKKRTYEFLNLQLFDKPKTNLEKEHNKETLSLAEAIKAKKILEAQSRQHGFISHSLSKISFLKFFKTVVDEKNDSLGNHGNWMSTYKHLLLFCKGADVTFEKVDEQFLESFKEYLLNCACNKGNRLNRLSRNTALSYFNKVRASLREAYHQKLIKENPATRVKCIKAEDTQRQFLTLEELQKLAVTPFEIPIFKTAFLFSALTGLRWSDIHALRWDNISFIETEGWFLTFTQKKTKGNEMLPVSEQAIKLLGKRKYGTDKVFERLVYSAWNNIRLQDWVKSANINKHITFHCARHSFATLQLSMNTDIYTISKLLGHKNLKTTEIYTKVIDRKKIDAANRMPDIF